MIKTLLAIGVSAWSMFTAVTIGEDRTRSSGTLLAFSADAPVDYTETAIDTADQQIDAEVSAAAAKKTYRRAPDGLFYVTASVNGEPVRFLVDTGATATIMTARDARRTGAPLRPGGGQIMTVAGLTETRRAHMTDMTVAGHRIRDVSVRVVDSGLPVSLLGQDLLQRFGSITIDGEHLRIQRRSA